MTPEDTERRQSSTFTLEGLAASPGLATGPALVLDTRRPGIVHRRLPKHAVDAEMVRFDGAVTEAAEALRQVAERESILVCRSKTSASWSLKTSKIIFQKPLQIYAFLFQILLETLFRKSFQNHHENIVKYHIKHCTKSYPKTMQFCIKPHAKTPHETLHES